MRLRFADDAGLVVVPALPPRSLPPPEALAQSAAAAPVLERFRALHAFCAPPGRRLTVRGHLSLADAHRLVEELETGDHTIAVRSAAGLPGLELLVRWARRARVVQVRHGRLVATASWDALDRSPERAFRRALAALLDVGPLVAWFSCPGPVSLTDAEIVEDCLPHLLAVLWAAGEPIGFEDFLDVTARVIDDQLGPVASSTEGGRESARAKLDTVVDALALAGIVVRHGGRIEPRQGTERRRVGGRMSLTPAGWAAVPGILAVFGYTAPVVGAWADAGAEELLTACAEMDAESMEAELSAWLDGRQPELAAGDLARAVADTKSPEVRLAGFHALGKLPEAAEPEVRRLALTPAAGCARLWLVEQGYEKRVVGPEDQPETVLEILSAALDQGGSEAVIDAVAAVGPRGEQAELVAGLWRVRSEAVLPVLEAIGSHQPDGQVARTARRGVLKHRSWMAGG